MRDCPKCGAPIDGAWCNQCGEGKKTVGRDPLRYLCHHETRGLRCSNLGVYSPNTVGSAKGGEHTGPWFCWIHANHIHGGQPHGSRPEPGYIAKLRAAMPRPIQLDAEAIAERLALQADAP